MSDTELLKGLIGCLDLTNLNDDCDTAAIETLCAKAQTPHGNVAAVCVWPKFVAQSKELLADTNINVATVVNFPHGGEDTLAVERETADALANGADEIDLVMAYRALAEGRPGFAETQIVRVKRICGDKILKVILETGELKDKGVVREASNLALAAGADFLKTSTGKVAVNATLDSAEILLSAIADTDKTKGFKAAGGIKTSADAIAYFEVAKRVRGDTAPNPGTFRIGASSVLDALVAAIEGREETAGAGY